MRMRRFEKIILSLLSVLVIAVFAVGLYIFLWQDDRGEELNFKVIESSETPSTTTSAEINATALQGPLTLPSVNKPKPVVASVDLSALWADTGFKDVAGLSEDPDLDNLNIEYTQYRVPVPYRVLRMPLDTLSPGEEYVHQTGQEGTAVVLTRVVYVDGQIVESSEVSKLVEQAQINEIVYFGPDETEAVSNQTAQIQSTEPTVATAAQTAESTVETTVLQVLETTTEAVENEEVASESERVSEEQGEQELEDQTEQIPDAMVQFMTADGTANSVEANLAILRDNGIFGSAGRKTLYTSFEDHGTYITVNGVNVPYSMKVSKTTTSYDGLLCCEVAGCHNPPINHNTASGVPANIGLCASNEYPFGTVLFVEEYGFCIVADRHGTSQFPDLVDVCYAPGEVKLYDFGRAERNVYVISIP